MQFPISLSDQDEIMSITALSWSNFGQKLKNVVIYLACSALSSRQIWYLLDSLKYWKIVFRPYPDPIYPITWRP